MRIVTLALFLSLALLPVMGKAQQLTPDGKGITMTLAEGAQIDYWGRKGIASESLISSLDIQIKLMEQEIEFQEFIIKNCQSAQEEYRNMVTRLGETNTAVNLKLSDTQRQLEIYKDRAKRRGQTIGVGVAVLGLLAYIGLK